MLRSIAQQWFLDRARPLLRGLRLLVSAQLSGRTGPAGKKRAIMFLLPFCFSAALATVPATAQADLNCYLSKLIDCEAPPYTSRTPPPAAGTTPTSCVFSRGC